MPYISYRPKNFSRASLETIEDAERIIADYRAQGYRLTLRQLYYQFVSRDLIPNAVAEYNRLGRLVSDARLAGLIDWDAIEDRTRNLASLSHWSSPADIVDSVSRQFRVDRWATQPYRIEVWIEKEALAGVFERVCRELDVPFLCCRGYTSQSEMWAAAQRLIEYSDSGQECVILHFGDHDPSGIDMTRDIIDRLELFEADVELDRLALNMDQVDEYSPPPNPAKTTDARFKTYLRTYGASSWELDALEPQVLADLVRSAVMELVDDEAWQESEDEIAEGRRLLSECADRWSDVSELLEDPTDGGPPADDDSDAGGP